MIDLKEKYYKDILFAISLIDEFLGDIIYLLSRRLIVKQKALLKGNYPLLGKPLKE